jgi:hypothetical protein
MKKTATQILFFILLVFSAKGQYFQTGQDPSQIKWRQINTGNFQVIFPQEFEIQAQKLTYILEKVYNYGIHSLNFRPKKVSVILHTYTANSNGLLAWAPKRMELFTTPNQQIYSQDWLEQLAIHEFRHLVQMDKIQSAMPGILKTILGEQAAAVVTGLYLPYWFLEGDAVATETSLSNSGRGRTASFSQAYRAQLLEKGKYSFDKAYLGSYKDFVTDYYKLGYLMVGKTRVLYGSDTWSNALENIGKKPFSITPLNTSLKATTKQSSKQLYNSIFNNLANEWRTDLQSRSIDSITVLSPAKKSYTEYLYPKVFHDSLIFAYRKSINDIGRFVLIYPNKSEQVIYTPGDIYEESASLTGNYIIWAEKRADLRWTHAEHSVIQVYNIETKTKKEFKTVYNLFSPVISPNLKTFAAVEVDKENNYSIGIYNLLTGERLDKIQTPDNQYFFTPSWDEKGEKLYSVSLSEKGKSLIEIELKNHQIIELTERTYANIKSPVISNESLYFTTDFSGVNLIYAFNLKSKNVKCIVSVPFGADFAYTMKIDNKLIFSNYTSGGFQLASIAFKNIHNREALSGIQLGSNDLADKLSKQEIGIPNFSASQSTLYKSKKYSKLGHLFNFHSWAPAYIDINSDEIRPGVSMFSQNKLGTAETKLGYDYNVNDRTGKYKLEFNYLGWFPEIATEISTGKEASNYYLIKNTLNQNHQIIKRDTTLQRFSWNEFNADIDIRLPLNLSRGKYSRIFYPEIKYSYVNISKTDTSFSNLYPFGYSSMAYRIYSYNMLHQSNQNLMPRWGQQFDIIYRHTLFNTNDLGTLFGIQSALYFPGLLTNDGFKLYQGFQNKTFANNGYSFSNFIRFPRGFYSYQNNKMYSASIDYKLPLLYPDLSLGKLAYIKRIKSSFFYDYAWLSMPTRDKNGILYPNSITAEMKSWGIELSSDLHLLRFFAPIEVGFRTTYRPDYKDFQVNLLLSVNFNGF